MKLIGVSYDITHPTIFKDFIIHQNKNIISDINDRDNLYQGEYDFLYEVGVFKQRRPIFANITRIVGNIEPHVDGLREFYNKSYLLVLDVSVGHSYPSSQENPLFYQNSEFMSLRKGDLIEFDNSKTHGLFWDKRIDIVTFFVYKPL